VRERTNRYAFAFELRAGKTGRVAAQLVSAFANKIVYVVFAGREVGFGHNHHNICVRRIERIYREVTAALHEHLDVGPQVAESRVMPAQRETLYASRRQRQAQFFRHQRMRAVRTDHETGPHVAGFSVRSAHGQGIAGFFPREIFHAGL